MGGKGVCGDWKGIGNEVRVKFMEDTSEVKGGGGGVPAVFSWL